MRALARSRRFQKRRPLTIGVAPDGSATAASNVNIPRPQRVRLDESATRLDIVAHQRSKDAVGSNSILDLHAKQTPHSRVHCCLPKLPRVHFTEALIALFPNVALGVSQKPLHRAFEVVDSHTALAPLDHRTGADQPLERIRRIDELLIVRGQLKLFIEYGDLLIAM